MDFSTAVQIVLAILAIGSWRQAKNPKLPNSERIADFTCSVYFTLLAVTIFLSRISLALAAKASSITAAALLAVGLFGKQASKDPRPHINAELEKRFEASTVGAVRYAGKSYPFLAIDHERWENSKLIASDITLLAIALGLTSAVFWAILLLRRP